MFVSACLRFVFMIRRGVAPTTTGAASRRDDSECDASDAGSDGDSHHFLGGTELTAADREWFLECEQKLSQHELRCAELQAAVASSETNPRDDAVVIEGDCSPDASIDGDDDEDANMPSFSELIAEIESAIDDLDGAVMPKLNWSAPKVRTQNTILFRRHVLF